MYELILDDSASSGIIRLGGVLKLQEINSIKEALLVALTKVNSLKINHSNAISFDLSYLQLIVSLQKTAAAQKKTVELEENHPVDFLSLVKESGCLKYSWLNIENEEDFDGGENG